MADDVQETQNQIRELQKQVEQLRDTISKQGGAVVSQAKDTAVTALNGASRKAEAAVDYVRDESRSAVAAAKEYPTATATALVGVGLIGVAIGYILGAAGHEPEPRRRYW